MLGGIPAASVFKQNHKLCASQFSVIPAEIIVLKLFCQYLNGNIEWDSVSDVEFKQSYSVVIKKI